MAHPVYPFSEWALAELAAFYQQGKRSYVVHGQPARPSMRDCAKHLRAKKLTTVEVSAPTIRRALQRLGLVPPDESAHELRRAS